MSQAPRPGGAADPGRDGRALERVGRAVDLWKWVVLLAHNGVAPFLPEHSCSLVHQGYSPPYEKVASSLIIFRQKWSCPTGPERLKSARFDSCK